MKSMIVACVLFSVCCVQASQHYSTGDNEDDSILNFPVFVGTSLGIASLGQRLQIVEHRIDQIVQDVSNNQLNMEYVGTRLDDHDAAVTSMIDNFNMYRQVTDRRIQELEDRVQALEEHNQNVCRITVSWLLGDSDFWNGIEERIAQRICALRLERMNPVARSASPLSSPESCGYRLPPSLLDTPPPRSSLPPPLSLEQSSLSDSD